MTEGSLKNQSLRKALDILEIMADLKHSVRLQDLAQHTGLNPSTLLRFLNTFIDYRYVKQDPRTSMYRLTLKLADMGYKVRANYPSLPTLQKYTAMITEKFGESSSVCIEDDMQMIYIATQEGPTHMLSTLSRIGKVAPMHSTGVGKIYLTQYSDQKLEKLANTRGLNKLTDKTITNIKDLKRELQKVKQQGYAVDEQECEVGVRCIAVPVRDYSKSIIAAISLSAPISRLSYKKTNSIINYLKKISAQASEEFGYLKNVSP